MSHKEVVEVSAKVLKSADGCSAGVQQGRPRAAAARRQAEGGQEGLRGRRSAREAVMQDIIAH